jgi:hypothetical protein
MLEHKRAILLVHVFVEAQPRPRTREQACKRCLVGRHGAIKPARKACERKGMGEGRLKGPGSKRSMPGGIIEMIPSGIFYVGLRLTTRRRLRRRVRFRRRGYRPLPIVGPPAPPITCRPEPQECRARPSPPQ